MKLSQENRYKIDVSYVPLTNGRHSLISIKPFETWVATTVKTVPIPKIDSLHQYTTGIQIRWKFIISFTRQTYGRHHQYQSNHQKFSMCLIRHQNTSWRLITHLVHHCAGKRVEILVSPLPIDLRQSLPQFIDLQLRFSRNCKIHNRFFTCHVQ